jgi:hypothetical protein
MTTCGAFNRTNIFVNLVGSTFFVFEPHSSQDMARQAASLFVATLNERHHFFPVTFNAGSQWCEAIAKSAIVN